MGLFAEHDKKPAEPIRSSLQAHLTRPVRPLTRRGRRGLLVQGRKGALCLRLEQLSELEEQLSMAGVAEAETDEGRTQDGIRSKSDRDIVG